MEKLLINSTQPAALAALILVLTALCFYGFMLFPVLAAGPAFLLLLASARIIIHFGLQPAFMKIIALLLPFSFEVPLIEGSMIRIPTEPLIVLAAMIVFLEILGRPLKMLKDPLHRELMWIAPLAVAFMLTIPFSEMLQVSVKFSFINLLYILVFFVFQARLFRNNKDLFFHMLILYSLGMLVVMLWSIYRFWHWEWNPVVVRGIFQPFFNDHTIFGAAAAFLAALWFSTISNGTNNLSRLIWFFPGLFFTGAVLLSTSRAAFLSLFVFILAMLMLTLKLRVRHLVLMTGGLVAVLILFHKPVTDRLQKIDAISYDSNSGLAERTSSVGNISTDVSNIERLNRWISAWRMFREKPLTGFGPGTYQFAYIPYQEPLLMNRLSVTNPWEVPEGSGGTAHSEYLLILSEMGIIGLAGWLIFLGRLIFISFNGSLGHPSRMMIIAAFAAMTTYVFHAHFNNFLNTDKFAFLFWGTAAWLISIYHSKNEENLLQAD